MVQYRIAERAENSVLLKLSGELANHFWSDHIRHVLEEDLVNEGIGVIRVDLSGVSFLDSYGVATLVSLLKESRDRGKSFVIEGAQGQVLEKLGVTGVLKVLQKGA